MSRRWKAAIERAVRTFVQASAAAALVVLTQDGADWGSVAKAASVGAFAGLIALVAMFAAPPKQEAPPE